MKRFARRMIFFVLFLYTATTAAMAADYLVPVGKVLGLVLSDNTLTVAAFDDVLSADTKAAGLKIGDQLVSIDGQAVSTGEDVRRALNRSDGTVDLEILREGKTKCLHLQPRITADGPKLGIYLKEGITGIGTVTWYDPQTRKFGALGHGVSDGNGQLLNLSKGTAHPARIVSIQKGKAGTPGQLRGTLEADHLLGSIEKNTDHGVFGSSGSSWASEAIPVAAFNEIRTGSAVIRSCVSEAGPRDYSVEILKIYPQNRIDGRNLLLKVTDPELLNITGGIVQGMSGSPIIQDGKLVGAVTHVLVNDPQTGYGIFIENMLEAAG